MIPPSAPITTIQTTMSRLSWSQVWFSARKMASWDPTSLSSPCCHNRQSLLSTPRTHSSLAILPFAPRCQCRTSLISIPFSWPFDPWTHIHVLSNQTAHNIWISWWYDLCRTVCLEHLISHIFLSKTQLIMGASTRVVELIQESSLRLAVNCTSCKAWSNH